MTKTEDKSLAGDVAALLERERDALLNGSLDLVADLVPLKAEIAKRLEEAKPSELSELQSMKSVAQRNQELLEQAMAGIRAAADRAAELRKIRLQLDTYDADGRKRTIQQSRKSIERRA